MLLHRIQSERKMMTFSSIIVTIFCLFCNLDLAFSRDYEALVVITNPSAPSGISLPNEANEIEGQINYPKKAEDGSEIEYSYLCPLRTPEVVRDVEKISTDYPELKFSLEKNPSIDNPTKCPTQVKPIFTKLRNPEQLETRCGESPNHLTFNFGFSYFRLVKDPPADIPDLRRRITTLSLYDIYFDTKELKTLWSKHRLETTSMFKNHPEQGFLSQKIPFPYRFRVEDYALPDNTFLKMVNEYREQDYDDYKMVPQMLVPESHLALKIWKKATTHMANTASLWKKLVPLMDAINDGIRKAAIAWSKKTFNPDTHQSDTLFIYTTASPYILQNKLVDTFDKAKISNIIPFGLNIWCKFIHNESKNTGVMIYLHNLPGLPPTEIDTSIEKMDSLPEKINAVPENIDTTSAKIDSTLKKINTTPEKINIAPEEIDTTSKDLKSDTDTILLGKAECETTVACNFENWSNALTELSDDIQNYAYCCEVDNKKIEELFNIKLDKKIELFDIERIINEKSI